jgi:hypothetical protein
VDENRQKGFSAVEGLLIVIISGMLGGVGWYVIHSQQQVDKTYSQTANTTVVPKSTAAKVPSTTSQPNYLTIKEWGVRLLVDIGDTLTYRVTAGNGNGIEVISKNLADKYGCNDFGAGIINRLKPSDNAAEYSISGTKTVTVEQAAKDNPDDYKKVGVYYYAFAHDQAACSSTVIIDAQNAANSNTKSLIPKLEAIPAQ